MLSYATWQDKGPAPEILLRIVSYALAQYIDDVIDGPLALQKGFSSELSYPQFVEITSITSKQSTMIAEMSPVVPLLKVSHTIRHVTLKIMAHVFNIQYIETGLGRLEGTRKPWMTLFTYRQQVWAVKSAILKAPLPLDEAAGTERGRPAVFALYYAIAVLERETAAASQFVDAFVVPSEEDAQVFVFWRGAPLSIAERWVQYAADAIRVERCPEIFREALGPRLADAVLRARTVALFAIGMHDVRQTWRQARDWHRHTLEEGDPSAVPPWAARLGNSLLAMVSKLRDLLRALPGLLAKLDETADTMPPTKPVDEVIGSRKYLALIHVLGEVTYWRAEGNAYEECRSEARAVHKLFLERLSARRSAHKNEAEQEAGEAMLSGVQTSTQAAGSGN
ncbi:hypothetical protein PsYK624_119090 [Phanerochaete sordida]|uniref:Uncharacterized protein n=1 Tax=Phanerochaete sordida TaxID=48140 RepID=A0A9P3GIU2_9APHY|nr:hypothetical protein PsYK624_119090 [Phanerochaete sordida]